jgi:hypothetical protein
VVMHGTGGEAPLGQEEHGSAADDPTQSGRASTSEVETTEPGHRDGRPRRRAQARVERRGEVSDAGGTRPDEGGRPDG